MRKSVNYAIWIGAATIALAASPAPAAIITQTTTQQDLVIKADDIPIAPPGKSLTLTVDGVERPVIPGDYRGKVVLTVTEAIPVKYHDLPEHYFRAAHFVEDGAAVTSKSVTSAMLGARIEAGKVSDARIISAGDHFNGIVVTGDGKYLIDRPIIDLTGNGGNDFAGFGAAIMASGKAEVTVERPIIRTRGAVRTALFVGGDATMRVNNASIEVRNGKLPADYLFTIEVGKMFEVPWMLGLSGNVRASNLVDNATLYITNSHIRTQGWGALSTDDAKRTRMYVKDSLIEATESGYGAYSIGDSHDHFSHSVIKVADIGAIMAGEGVVTFTDRTLVYAGRYGVMMHSGMGGGALTIDKGSELHAKLTAIQVKGLGTTITVDDAIVMAGNGIILQSMENDDPFMIAMMRGETPEGMGPPAPGAAPGGPPSPPPGMGPPRDGPPPSPDVNATFRNVTLTGNLFNGRTGASAMKLRFERVSLTGQISTSTVAPASGQAPTRATYQEIGNVVNTPIASNGRNGISVQLDGSSHWSVTGSSYLSNLELAPGARIDAGAKKLVVTLNGKAIKLKPGKISGNILLSVK